MTQRSRKAKKSRNRRKLWQRQLNGGLESLEARQLLAAVVVGNSLDVVDGVTTSISALQMSPGSDGSISLREAIVAANNTLGADEISFDAGVFAAPSLIRLNHGDGELRISDDLSISGPTAELVITGDVSGNDATIGSSYITDVFNNGNTSDNVRVFNVASGTVTLNQLTITGGVASSSSPDENDGAGIRVADASVTLNVVASTLSGNRTFGSTAYGGGISNAGTATFTDSKISGNRSGAGGGGIHNSTDDNLIVQNSVISDNHAGSFGGGINNAGTATLFGVTLAGNTASVFGGGIQNSFDDVAVLTNVTLVGNSSDQGGAVSNFGTATLTNSTLTGNIGSTSGGGIHTRADETTNLRNCIVLGNNSDEVSGATPNTTSSIVGGDATVIFANTATVGGTEAGVLKDNGGTIQTVALAPTTSNPALDTGNVSLLNEDDAAVNVDLNGDGDTSDTITTDARGFVREVDFPGTGTTLLDLGASETQEETPGLIVTTDSDVIDAYDFLTSLREAVNFANSQSGSDTITFGSSLSGGTLTLTQGELALTSDITIDGDTNGDDKADITLSGNNASRIFHISGAATDVDLQSLTLTDGDASRGGAILADSASSLDISDSTITGNTAAFDGGGFASFYTPTIVTNTLIINNTADGSSGGGGAFLYGAATSSFTNTTVHGNIATSQGGGIYAGSSANLYLFNSTITGNRANTNDVSATLAGGGIRVDSSPTINLTNSVIAENTSGTANTPDDVDGMIDMAVHSFIGTVETITTNTNTTNGGGDPRLAPLADNGGTTQTRNPLAGSPLINTGDNGSIPVGLTLDANGNPRILDGIVDIGATEALIPASFVVSTPADVDDGDFSAGNLSLREAVSLANVSPGSDTITFDSSLSGSTLTLTEGELALTSDITIDGDTNGDDKADITLSGNNASRIFHISGAATDVDLQSLTLTDGDASRGGAILADSASSLDISDSTITGNTAAFDGGGFASFYTPTIVTNTLIINNTADGSSGGGGAFLYGAATSSFTNTTIHGNSATSRGGGIYTGSAVDLSLFNSTVTGNRAETDGVLATGGGGIRVDDSPTINFTNSVVAENTSGSANTPDDVAGTIDTAIHSFIGTVETITNNTNSTNGGGDPSLAPLADNGGTTQTRNPHSDSPLINAGDNGSIPVGLTLDANGNPRISDGAVDIGATELQAEPFGLVVTTTDDVVDQFDFVTSLREAIEFANTQGGAATITFAAGAGDAFENGGVIRLVGELVIDDSSEITIDGASAGGTLIITGDVDADDTIVGGITDLSQTASSELDDNVRVFNITSGTVNLNDLTITGGVRTGPGIANDGGAIAVDDAATLNLLNSTVAGNQARFGGGVNNRGTTTISDSHLWGNVATHSGGGINNSNNDSLTLTGTIVSGNRATGTGAYAGDGGGISNYGTATISGSTISENSANNDGGGIQNEFQSTLVVRDTTLSANAANGQTSTSGDGGGINNLGAITLLGVTLTGNTASKSGGSSLGGGVNNSNNDTAVLTNVTLVGNTANQGGGLSNFGTATFTNSTLTGNSGTTDGGGIFTSTGDATVLRNTIVLGNNTDEISGEAPSSTSSIVGGNAADVFANTTTVGGVEAGVLADNGGPVQTVALKVDANNPALDAGDATLLVEATVGVGDLNGDGDAVDTITMDARGQSRVVDFIGIGTSDVDLGAYELQSESPSLIVTTAADVVDELDLLTSLREAIAVANSQNGPDSITFDASLFSTPQTITLSGSELRITDSVDIIGPGEDLLTVSGNDASRIFRIDDGTTAVHDVSLSEMTLRDGREEDVNDGGGAIYTTENLVITRSTITNNFTEGGLGGGGIYKASPGKLTVVQSTISGNVAENTGKGGGGIFIYAGVAEVLDSTISGNRGESSSSGSGGGISNYDGSLLVSNTTISGNTSVKFNDSVGDGGGGIGTNYGSGLIVRNSTITNNRAIEGFGHQYDPAGGGIFVRYGGPATIENTIVAGNSSDGTANDIRGNVASSYSLIQDTDGATITDNGGTITGVDPVLGPLRDNGGPTRTHGISVSGPAFNAGDSSSVAGAANIPAFDQRGAGFDRVLHGRIDIGAFELRFLDNLVVSTTADGDDGDYSDGQLSLREAIAFAELQPGVGTITFDAALSGQTITLDGTELEITDTLAIDASALANGVAIDANQGSRVLNFSASTGDLTLDALTITGGRTTDESDKGGGIRFDSSGTLRITNSTVMGNSTTGERADGGGIYVDDGTVIITDSTISENSTTGVFAQGGGIMVFRGTATITNSTVSGNSTFGDFSDGGGVYARIGPATITNSTFSGNSTMGERADGGGILLRADIATITNSTFSGNSTMGEHAHGGGVAVRGGGAKIFQSTVSGNSTSGPGSDGGGIDVSATTFTLTDSTVSGNSTTDRGGGIYNERDGTIITNSTISGNSAGSLGGGVSNSGVTKIRFSTITANTAPIGSGSGVASIGNNTVRTEVAHTIIAGNTNEDVAVVFTSSNNSFQSGGYNLIGTGGGTLDGAANFTATGDQTGVTDPRLEPLADNGGPTRTHAPLAGSPAIDAGDPSAVAGVGDVPFFDQRGLPELRVRDGRIDIGAFELPGTTVSLNLVVSTTTDEVDGNTVPGQLSLREALLVSNVNPGADTITFDPTVFTGDAASLIRLSGTELTISDEVTIDGSTGTDIVITADANGDDALIGGTFLTDAATNGNTPDNSRVLNITAGTVNLNNLTITGGVVTGSNDGGGLLVNFGATLNLTGSIVAGNSSRFGAGVNNRGTTTIATSTISGNQASSGGGGVSNSTDDMLTVIGSTIFGNTAGTNGGGIVNYGTAEIINSTISQNSAAGDGGGIHNSTNDVLMLNSVTVFGNDAAGTDGGGGVHNVGTATLNNTIVAGSTAGGDLAGSGTFNGAFNLIEDGNTTGLTATLSGDPLLQPLADNGGPTQTHALPLGSPAINTGDPSFDPNAFTPPLVNDQRGLGFNRVALGQIDIGAFEAAQLEAPATGTDILIQQHSVDPMRLEILLDGDVVASVTITQPDDLVFVSYAGQDQSLTVDYSLGYFDSTGAISFAGNAGDNDQLRVVGDSSPRLTRATYPSSTAFGTGSVQTANGFASSTIAFVDVATLNFSSLLSFGVEGLLSVAQGESLIVDATGFVDLDSLTILDGGVFEATGGILVDGGEILLVTGTYDNTPIATESGAVVQATGDVTLGDATSVAGFFADGHLHVGAHTVTINDANEAVLGSLTTLADGRLVAGTATPDLGNDNAGLPDHLLLEDGKNVTGRGNIAGNFRNMGSVIGDGTAPGERIVFDDGFTVTGIGFAENVLVEGTFAPGLSPGVVSGRNIALAGSVRLELGGTNPGTGDSFHDQIHDLGEMLILSGASLEVLPWSNFQPSVGDEFEVLVADGSLTGTFDNVVIDPAFAAMGIHFDVEYSANGLKLVAVPTPASCDFDFDFDCDIDDIDAMVMEIAAGANDLTFDLTGDNLVDLADRDQWLADAGALNLVSGNAYLLGDANLDGTVDGSDFLTWNAHKFSTTGRWSQGDWNGDGITDGRDFLIWNANKFRSSDSGLPADSVDHAQKEDDRNEHESDWQPAVVDWLFAK